MGVYDNSWANYFQFIKISFLTSTTGCAAGIMWGTIFDTEAESLTSSLLLIVSFTLGAGKFVNLTNKSVIIKLFTLISPMKYSTELMLRTVVSGREDQERFLLNIFGLNDGQRYSEYMLLSFSVVFFMIGWAIMLYKARFL